jgi:hypothetical protein
MTSPWRRAGATRATVVAVAVRRATTRTTRPLQRRNLHQRGREGDRATMVPFAALGGNVGMPPLRPQPFAHLQSRISARRLRRRQSTGCARAACPGSLLGIGGPRGELGDPVEHVGHQVEAIDPVAHGHVERSRRGPFLLVPVDVEIPVVRPAVGQPVDEPWVAVLREDDGLVGGEEVSKCSRKRLTAASVSNVGTSPADAMTTSGTAPRSLLAHSQMPMPAVQCLMAASRSRYCRAGCLPATMTLT